MLKTIGKTILCGFILLLAAVEPASATTVYLKDGSWLKAIRVWRSDDKVEVLVNRYSSTSFDTSEVNLKKTFPPGKPRKSAIKTAPAVKTVKQVQKQQRQSIEDVIDFSDVAKQTDSAKTSGRDLKMPKLPTALPDKLPEREIPRGSKEGTLRKQKHEMEEHLNE